MSIDGLVDSETAARLLGVTTRRVSQLAESGDITKATRGLYDRLSIESYLITRRGTSERAWGIGTAWAAVAVLSGRRRAADWLSERSIYRLEATLRVITVAELVSKARGRASVHVFDGHRSVANVLRREVVVREWAILGLAGPSEDVVDGYVTTDELESLTARYALVASTSGNITLRATTFDLDVVRSLAKASDALVALDAAGSIDARARGAGEHRLDRALSRFHDPGA